MPDTSPLPQFPLELTDADATLQVQALVASADDTGELCADDILEEKPAVPGELPSMEVLVDVDDPFPSPRMLPRALPKPTPPRRTLPPPPTAPGRGSISFAPVAFDVSLEPPPRSRRRADSTVLVPRVRVAQTHKLYQLVGAAAVLALFGLGSLATTLAIGLGRPSSSSANGSTATTAEARVAAHPAKELDTRTAERAVLIPEPPPAWAAPPAPARVPDPPRADPPSPPPATASLAAATRAPVTAAPAPARASGVGTIRVPPSVHGMLVDGRPRRVDGATSVTCGRHTVKTGITPSRTVDVPCGGTAWL